MTNRNAFFLYAALNPIENLQLYGAFIAPRDEADSLAKIRVYAKLARHVYAVGTLAVEQGWLLIRHG